TFPKGRHRMQRRSFLKNAGLSAMAGAASVGAPAIAKSNPKISWKLTSTYGPSLQPFFNASQSFCKMIEEASDGNFSIRLYPPGALVPGYSVMDAVSNGT